MNFTDRIKALFRFRGAVSEELFDDLSDLLVEGDFGAAEAYAAVEELRTLSRRQNTQDPEALRRLLAELLERDLRQAARPALDLSGFTVLLLLGVNGVGKTTTAAKLAHRCQAGPDRRVVLAAADTFRAAAIDQLKIHGQRIGARVVAHKHGGDPAAVVFDALEAAQSGVNALVIADTAGRMHTKAALVEELKKIDRVVALKAAGAGYVKLLVLDATTGRNALVQAETFNDAVRLDGVVLTKYDSSARGGVAFSLSRSLSLPVVYVCTGEGYGDIADFDPRAYAREFVGLE